MKKADKMLWEGVEENDLKKVLWALNLGADVNAKDKYGWSPLHYAVNTGNTVLVELLISAGAKVNAKSKWGILVFHVSVWRNNEEMQDLLKQHGATF